MWLTPVSFPLLSERGNAWPQRGGAPISFPVITAKAFIIVDRSPCIAAVAGDEGLIADTRKRSIGKCFLLY